MADSKLSGLGELAAVPAPNDYIEVTDVSDTSMDASGTSKKAKASNVLGGTLVTMSATTQINPSIHPHNCTFVVFSDYGNQRALKLPALASQPPAGTRYFFIARDAGGGGRMYVQDASGAQIIATLGANSPEPIHAMFTYLGSNEWAFAVIDSTVAQPSFIFTNTD